jgi:ABC-2 type transport system ATP-binding protein
MAIIEAHGLKKQFKSGKTVIDALRGINLSVAEGGIIGLLGPNGAGKTTLLRILTTLLQPDAGTAQIVGLPIDTGSTAIRRKIGYVSQQGGAEAAATGRENVLLQARLYGMSAAEAKQRVGELLVGFELESIADRVVQSYSGGQRRRLDLAMGMVHRPVLLFLDEPAVGLDPQSRARLWDEVRSLHQAGTTVVITTHYLDEADALCDQVAIIDHGQIIVEDSPAGLKRTLAGDVVRLGICPAELEQAQTLFANQAFVRDISCEDQHLRLVVEQGETALPQILHLVTGHGLSLQTITLDRPSLDDVFLHYTGRSLRDA